MMSAQETILASLLWRPCMHFSWRACLVREKSSLVITDRLASSHWVSGWGRTGSRMASLVNGHQKLHLGWPPSGLPMLMQSSPFRLHQLACAIHTLMTHTFLPIRAKRVPRLPRAAGKAVAHHHLAWVDFIFCLWLAAKYTYLRTYLRTNVRSFLMAAITSWLPPKCGRRQYMRVEALLS
jgi:hypothetical protein